jgi:CO/xanthine dehydrogenase FAD-binding subunit
VLAGGTDSMVPSARAAAGPVKGVIDLFTVDELHCIDATFETMRIGACTTYAELLASGALRATLPLLAAAAREIGAEQIRERGTIGGNVVTCSPVGDMLPGLLALDAGVVVASERGSRTVEYERFVRGYRDVDLAPDELLVAVEIPRPDPGTVQHWRKVGTRAAQSIAKLSFAATARLHDGRATHVRVAFGGVADHPIRLHDVEAIVEGAVPDGALAVTARDAVLGSLHPITDVRSSADYRRDVAANLVARFVSGLAG